jgi:hypothetical protein
VVHVLRGGDLPDRSETAQAIQQHKVSARGPAFAQPGDRLNVRQGVDLCGIHIGERDQVSQLIGGCPMPAGQGGEPQATARGMPRLRSLLDRGRRSHAYRELVAGGCARQAADWHGSGVTAFWQWCGGDWDDD